MPLPWNRASASGFMSKVPTDQLGMKVLYEGSQIAVDVVAVHGLGAIPDITWREKTSRVNWLQDEKMLPQAIPNSRIMRFGYDSLWFCYDPVRTRAETISTSFLANLEEHRRDCPNRPVIFIGHCFGGLVVQKALTLDYLKNDFNSTILSITSGIIFLGTPHSGTVTSTQDRINHSSIISLLLATSDLRLDKEVLKNLDSSNNTLSDISKDFLQVCVARYNAIIVVNFFEQRSSNVGKMFGRNGLQEFVVGEASATLGHYPAYGLPLDHYSLNKFASPDDGNFKLVQGQIRRIYSNVLTTIVETPQTPNPPLYSYSSLNDQRAERLQSAGRSGASSDAEVETLATWTRSDLQTLWQSMILYPLAYNRDVSDLKSINSTTSTSITFVNKAPADVNVDWINYQGERIRYLTLKHDGVHRIQTFVGHPWEVVVGGCATQFLPTVAAEYTAFIGSTDKPTLIPLSEKHVRSTIPTGAATAVNFFNYSGSNVNTFWIESILCNS